MKHRMFMLVMVAVACVASLSAFNGRPNKKVVTVNSEGVEVKGKDADIAVKATADRIDEILASDKLSERDRQTLDGIATAFDKYTKKDAWHLDFLGGANCKKEYNEEGEHELTFGGEMGFELGKDRLGVYGLLEYRPVTSADVANFGYHVGLRIRMF